MLLVKVRLKPSGQVVEFVPNVAYAKIGAGAAELVDDPNERLGLKAKPAVETTQFTRALEQADAPPQSAQTAAKPAPAAKPEPPKNRKGR